MLVHVGRWLIVLMALCVLTQASFAVERWPATRVGESESEQRIREQLDKNTELSFEDAPLSDLVAYLADLHQIPIVIDSRGSQHHQTDIPAIPVTINLQGVSLRSALAIMLSNLNLDYVIRDEVLLITTPEIASSSAPLCLFDVASFAQAPEDLDLLLSTVQSYANRYSAQITMYRNVMLVKGNQRQQDDIAAFLAALFKAQAQAQPMPGAATTP